MTAVLTDDRKIVVQQRIPSKQLERKQRLDPLTQLPAFRGPARGRRPMPLQGGLKDSPAPLGCWECGKAIPGKQIRFCSKECARAFPVDELCRRAGGLAAPMLAWGGDVGIPSS